jgi:plastocyanin
MAFVLTSCGVRSTPPAALVTPPAIGVQITSDNCPSIEARPDMQISWTNVGNVDLVLSIEHQDEQGVVMESGGTDLLQPGASFSINLTSPGEYTFYCSKDRTAFGTILITE